MTNEQVIKRINEIREILADYRELTSYDHEALDIAISALSKQSASCEQADKKLFGHGYWLMPGEVFISHNVLNEVLDTIIKSMNTEQRKIDSILAKTAENDEAPPDSDQIADGSKMVDQFRDITKKTDLISRQAAIDALDEQITQCDKALGSFDISMNDEYAVKVERASLKAYRETLNVLPSAQPDPCDVCKWYDDIDCTACVACPARGIE